MKCIERIILHNFKRFTYFEEEFDPNMNILIGDNESGKSSILQAIDIVLSGSRNKVETYGLESLFNTIAISDFMSSDRKYENLPVLYVELFLNEQHNQDLFGRNNTKNADFNGLKLICRPNDELSADIQSILQERESSFPFEFYSIEFKTFADQSYNNYSRFIRSIVVDNSQMSGDYAMKEYVRDIYLAKMHNVERIKNQHQYRLHKERFKNDILAPYNERLGTYMFSLKNTSKSNLETDLTIIEDNVCIENKGKGRQCFIKTELALQRSHEDLDIVLLEEPENHLSHTNMQKLISNIKASDNKQLFIATHSDLISTRLNLRKTILLNSSTNKGLRLNNIPEDTANFFIKAPDNNMLQFVLSKKVILVEGDAEYIMMDVMFKNVIGNELEQSGINVIAVNGKCFKRYLEISKILNIKTAVITDNDSDYDKNINQCYDGYVNNEYPHIKIFADNDSERRTFEICIHKDNSKLCEELWGGARRKLSVIDYMLTNKSEASYRLATAKPDNIATPQYIENALRWINE